MFGQSDDRGAQGICDALRHFGIILVRRELLHLEAELAAAWSRGRQHPDQQRSTGATRDALRSERELSLAAEKSHVLARHPAAEVGQKADEPVLLERAHDLGRCARRAAVDDAEPALDAVAIDYRIEARVVALADDHRCRPPELGHGGGERFERT